MGKERQNKDYATFLRILTGTLRKTYYRTGSSKEKLEKAVEPAVLNAEEGLGNFPAVYTQGPHCARSDCGCCTNCFYSQFHYEESSNEDIQAQCNFVFDNFDELILSQQERNQRVRW